MPSANIPIHATLSPQRIDRNGFSVREDVLYTDTKGREKAKLRKRADDAFESLGEVLRRILEPNETIFDIAQAQVMPSAGAQLFGGGWHTYSLPRAVLFFTERRVIALRVRKRIYGWSWERGIRTAKWGDIESAKVGGFLSRYLVLKFRDGEKLTYWRFASGDMKKVKLLIDTLHPRGSGETTAAGAMASLCPTCLAALSARNYQCPNCGLRFKDERTLLWRGLLIPGGASLYVGATGLGLLRAIFETLAILAIINVTLVLILKPVASAEAESATIVLCTGCFILIADKLSAIVFARPQIRDFLPVD